MSTTESPDRLGSVNPYHPPEGFTSHYEPPEVGGARYWKCDHCGVESVSWRTGEMTSEFVHRDECDNPYVGDTDGE